MKTWCCTLSWTPNGDQQTIKIKIQKKSGEKTNRQNRRTRANCFFRRQRSRPGFFLSTWFAVHSPIYLWELDSYGCCVKKSQKKARPKTCQLIKNLHVVDCQKGICCCMGKKSFGIHSFSTVLCRFWIRPHAEFPPGSCHVSEPPLFGDKTITSYYIYIYLYLCTYTYIYTYI